MGIKKKEKKSVVTLNRVVSGNSGKVLDPNKPWWTTAYHPSFKTNPNAHPCPP